VALLAYCGPKDKFAINHSMFLRSQSKWITPMVTANAAQRARWRDWLDAAGRADITIADHG